MAKNSLLRAARHEKGWSQQELADFAQLSPSTIERAERGKPIRVDSIKRLCSCLQKTPEQLGLLVNSTPSGEYDEEPELLISSQILHQEQFHITLSPDYLSFLESEMKVRWSLYHTGGTQLVFQGLHTWVQHISNCANLLRGKDLYERALKLLSMGYQLQGSVLRDMMRYSEAYMAHRKAFLIAQGLFDPELIASALVREGITLNQQECPTEAIKCFNHALETIKRLEYVGLEGYIYQALSEAQAKAQKSQESWNSISLAEKKFERQSLIHEQTLTRYNTSSLEAQKGVNSILLNNYKQAVDQLDSSLIEYDPTLIRGRARLLMQKSEAYYGLGILDACVSNLKEAFILASSAGSSKIISKVHSLHKDLTQSKWRKERVVADLSNMLDLK